MTDPQDTASARVHWRKSSFSTGQNDCVEVAQVGRLYAVRDSKDSAAVGLMFPADAWEKFISEIKRGGRQEQEEWGQLPCACWPSLPRRSVR